jgi:hypothetical protein
MRAAAARPRTTTSGRLVRAAVLLVFPCLVAGLALLPSGGTAPANAPAAEPGPLRPADAARSAAAPERVHVADPLRTVDADASPAAPAGTAGAPDPETVPLPTIAGRPPDELQARWLRSLAHGMRAAGLSCALPAALTQSEWDLLDAWTAPLRAEREQVAKACNGAVHEAVAARLAAEQYEVRRSEPAVLTGAYFSWRHARDEHGGDVVHVVCIPHGELPVADAARERLSLIDRDVAVLARTSFDRAAK